jgi:hypothetical protein
MAFLLKTQADFFKTQAVGTPTKQYWLAPMVDFLASQAAGIPVKQYCARVNAVGIGQTLIT